MCGICGELRFDGLSPDLVIIQRMSEKLARRGPDHAGTFSDGPLAFGHRRLAIIDLSASADQPMVDDELQLALVFNGTIYNYRELRVELLALGEWPRSTPREAPEHACFPGHRCPRRRG
jgi:asparagine synthase (glutamine-hydrolysing)